MTEEYQSNRRAPLTTLAHYNLEEEEPPSDASLKVLVVDRRGSFGSDIERATRSLEQAPTVVFVSHPTRVLEEVHIESPDVVLAAPEEMTATGLRRLAQVHRASPKTVIALTQGAVPISMTEAAACGASEVISYPASNIKLRNALHRILATAEAVRGERVVIREVPAPAPPPAQIAPAPMATGNAKVFTVTSPTGGCGKTFFATNLAAYLVGVTGGRVLLVDLDLQFGEVSLALGLRPQRTISELINEDNMLEAFPDYLVDHSSGYKVLSAPADPFAAELVGPREATQVLECARGLFDYVVVDTPPSLNEVVLAAFDQSRYLVVMATLDVPSLRNLRVFLETIERLKLPAEDVSCILNKAEPDNGIDLQELLRVYPRGFAAVLPYSKEVSRSLNVGQPVLMVDPKAEISQKLLEAGAKLVPAGEVTNPAWGSSRSSARVSWSDRRKERHGHTQPIQAPPPSPAPPAHQPRPAPHFQPAPLHHEAPAAPAATWAVPAESPAEPAGAEYAAGSEGQGEEYTSPSVLPPATVPAWASPEWTPPPAAGQTPGGVPAGVPATVAMGPPYRPPTGKTSWLGRLFGRSGRHSAHASQTFVALQPLQARAAQPSLATQMQVGPQSGPRPGSDQGPGWDQGKAAGQTNRFGGPQPEPGSSSLVFSGSRPPTPTPQAPQGRRQRPPEASSTTRKEPKR